MFKIEIFGKLILGICGNCITRADWLGCDKCRESAH